MADNNSEEEPSIEEILSSIRQIISDEDEEEAEDDIEEEVVESPIHEDGDDVLELTEDDLVEDDDIMDVLADITEEDGEEDSEAEEVLEAPPEPEAAPEPEPVIEEPIEEPVVEIDMRDRAEEPETLPQEEDDIDAHDIIEQIRLQTEQEAKTMPSDILSSAAQTAALGSLNKLKTKMPINNPRSYDGVTLEDIVREALHPMLREWMDDNLPRMVERIVQKELEKLARRAMDD